MTNNQLTKIKDLYSTKKKLSKDGLDISAIDNQIDEVLGRETLRKKTDKIVSLFDGNIYNDISIGGKFKTEHGVFTVQDIREKEVKVKNHWHHKSEFEPCDVLKYKTPNMEHTR